jgi:FKBP-type peptidyl-prolyl cis-trans isomerase
VETADGVIFDSSYERGKPMSFAVTGVIGGWTEGLQLMKVGGKARLTIPSHLGYGDKGSPPKIPPKATLTFTVELLGIKDALC